MKETVSTTRNEKDADTMHSIINHCICNIPEKLSDISIASIDDISGYQPTLIVDKNHQLVNLHNNAEELYTMPTLSTFHHLWTYGSTAVPSTENEIEHMCLTITMN